MSHKYLLVAVLIQGLAQDLTASLVLNKLFHLMAEFSSFHWLRIAYAIELNIRKLLLHKKGTTASSFRLQSISATLQKCSLVSSTSVEWKLTSTSYPPRHTHTHTQTHHAHNRNISTLHNYDILQIFPRKNVTLSLSVLFSSWNNQFLFNFILHDTTWRQDSYTTFPLDNNLNWNT